MSDYWSSSGRTPQAASPPWATRATESEIVRPPLAALAAVAAVVVVTALLFVIPVDGLNVVGYVVGGFGTTIATIAYRHVDLVRRRHSMYVNRPAFGQAVATLLFLGIVLGVVHIYFALRTTVVQ